MLLSNAKPKMLLIIENISLNELLKKRLRDLGVIEGVEIEVIRYAPFSSPIEIKVKNTYLAIRKKDARRIVVKEKL